MSYRCDVGLVLGYQDPSGSKGSYVDHNEEQQHIYRLAAQSRHFFIGLRTAQLCSQLLKSLGSCKVCTASDISSLHHHSQLNIAAASKFVTQASYGTAIEPFNDEITAFLDVIPCHVKSAHDAKTQSTWSTSVNGTDRNTPQESHQLHLRCPCC